MIMRDDMYENNWSPFDPRWYQAAFDQFVSTADQLFNQDLIIQQGFNLPDADGSRSSVFRNEAVLNNSFNEQKLRETLKDIYLNSSHRLVAANNDNVHFYQWHGYMSNMELIPNTDTCQFVIPTTTFISPKERDKFKLSQFYRKWIKPEDLLNNWEIFKWYCMLFIDQKVYSEYELRIDDHETTIRFKYYDYWVKVNHPVYIYKFDTNASCRVLISKELCENQWNWKMPTSYINDQRVVNSTNIVVAFNKISDQNIRKDGKTHIEVLGDNLEFLTIEDGIIDLSNISSFNNQYIRSESTEWLWMSIIIPKFLHEYPIILPTDVVYRPYEADLRPVAIYDNMGIRYNKAEKGITNKQIYIDMNGRLAEEHSGWKQMIRPIVLSDAFDDPFNEPYMAFIDELSNLRDLTVKGADTIEDFRFFMEDNPDEDKFQWFVEKLMKEVEDIHNAYNTFLKNRRIDTDKAYEYLYKDFYNTMLQLQEDGIYSDWFNRSKEDEGTERDFWFYISPQIYIPREMYDKFSIVYTLESINDNGLLWNNVDQFMNQHRFRRPIEEGNFWTFEWDNDDKVWRPYHLNITRHFPDVYFPKDPASDTAELGRIFKAFFFYSDTMNVLNQSEEIVDATPAWDVDMQEYEFDRGAVYRDIFMEKFYWMGVRSIYKGLIITKSRWEALEYVIDNSSYERFNELFLRTMDPYFKLGLATYLKSSNYSFPFDDAISKMNEAIDLIWLGYKKITNFEVYLNKTWIPSYFDYIVKIMDEWEPGTRLLRRPRSSFDVLRLLPMLISIEDNITIAVGTVNETLKWILEKLMQESYHLNFDNILSIQEKAQEMLQNIKDVYKFTNELDLDIYGIEDLNHIISKLKHHMELTDELELLFKASQDDVTTHNVYKFKQDILKDVSDNHLESLYGHITLIGGMVQDFDMHGFMLAVNDLYTYFEWNKVNPDDKSLIGYVNQFNDPWSVKVKELRNKLFQSTAIMYGEFDSSKAYTNDEVIKFTNSVESVRLDIENFSNAIAEFWTTMGYDKDQTVIDKFDYVNSLLDKLIINLGIYMDARAELLEEVARILELLMKMHDYDISKVETTYLDGIKLALDNIVLSLSYIAGANHRDDAIKEFNKLKNNIVKWNGFLSIEEEVFTKLLAFTTPPIEFIERLRKDEAVLNEMIVYMDSANIPYVPDSSWPTYSDVFEVDQFELVDGGFYNKVDEFVAAPKLGSYKINEVSDNEIGVTKAIESTGYRGTVYRNPMVQNNFYDTVTNGDGMGITIKPLRSKRIPIINDEVVRMYIMRIQNSSYLVSNNLDTPNPYSNIALETTLAGIEEINNDWNNMLDIYSEHMSIESKEYVGGLIDLLESIIEPARKLIELRNNVDLAGLITDLDSFITNCYEYARKNDLITDQYYYYEENVKVALVDFQEFYGSGTSWNSSSQLRSLLDDAKYPIRLFKVRTLDIFPHSDEKTKVSKECEDLLNKISTIETTLSKLPNMIVDITPISRKLEEDIKAMPSDLIKKDKWYRIRNIRVALEGEGYKIGDILAIIPELPVDTAGNKITDQEDLIMNDTILVRINEVIDGRVTGIEALMDYAIPYLIWGVRRTKTLIGKGKGLTVDVYSYELELSDSTLFQDSSSDIARLPQYNENDMFVFKFENVHDLNMQYEVFYGGKQITNFFQRHISGTDRLHPSSVDALYLNANDVSDLKNSSIYIPAEHYFIYRLDKVVIKDPGAGYAVGQEVFVDLETIALRLKIASLVAGPTKGIASVEMSDIRINEDVDNPSCEEAKVVPDSLNNIDDEFNVGYYDRLTKEGIVKGSTKSLDPAGYDFISRRFDDLEDGDRNKRYMYPDVNMPDIEGVAKEGDPDEGFYQGSRIDNPYHPIEDDHKWNGIMNTISPTDPFIPDCNRVPPGQPIKGEYQLIGRQRIHDSTKETNDNVTVKFDFSIKNAAMIDGDYSVSKYSQLPKHMLDWPDAKIGKCVIVENDETNNGHRMMYRLRTFVAAGYFVYDLPEVADYKWNHFEVDWMNCDFYPDYPSNQSKFSDAPWFTAKTFLAVQRSIVDGTYTDRFPVVDHYGHTYIKDLTVDDLSVWNNTTHEWEDLHDETKWKLEVTDSPTREKWGFKLTYLEEGTYSYDMQLYLNKVPSTQMRNATMKRDAVMDIAATMVAEVNNPAINTFVNTGRHLRIRKLFPYEQKETFTIGRNPDGSYKGYEMDFIVAPYLHFRNELHLEDVKIYNKHAGRFENLLDTNLFEVRFKDPKAIATGYETQTKIVQTSISYSGEGFVDGEIWAYNQEFGISVFGVVTADYKAAGHLLTFTPIHTVNPPTEDIGLEFQVFQRDTQTNKQMGLVIIEFQTDKVEVHGDGYIHNVTNRFAPLPKEFKIICKYNLDTLAEYDVIISKTARQWKFIESKWMVSPTFHLPDYNVQQDRVYILTSQGRFPLKNPSTGKPSINVIQKENGTDVTFLNLYKQYEHLEVRTVPYPMKSVYVQRNIPKSGFIDLAGKINKPLNKKYFEFWVNGRLLFDEVTIITPTKIFLHGLKSLKNLEIIEVNRDPNEYFSDTFLEVDQTDLGRPYYHWNLRTYLDAALEGELEEDNYTPEEQELLLSPVWKQVAKDHPEFKNYPPNVDIESDILSRVDDDDYPLDTLEDPTYQFMILNAPTLEGLPIVDRSLTFDHFGFIPMTDFMIIDIMNEEWAEEIGSNPYFPEHSVMTDAEWYGMTARLYDEYGIRVHTLDEKVYSITDTNLLRINTETKLSRIVKNNVKYDLT